MPELLRKLSEEGGSMWLDDLSRSRLMSGSLARLVRERHGLSLDFSCGWRLSR
jgi:transaldolase